MSADHASYQPYHTTYVIVVPHISGWGLTLLQKQISVAGALQHVFSIAGCGQHALRCRQLCYTMSENEVQQLHVACFLCPAT